jgi:hypothetical protein
MHHSVNQVVSQPPNGFFQSSLPANLILLAFFVITIPLTVLITLNPTSVVVGLYIWLFSMTHFVITFAIYLNRSNLTYFSKNWSNRIIYFILPISIFVILDICHVTQFGVLFPGFALFVFALIRLMDFNHLNRQSFGVLQFFKLQSELNYPATIRRWEMIYFNLWTLLLFTTYLSGGTSPFLQGEGPLHLGILEMPVYGRILLPIDILQFISLGLGIAIGLVFLYLNWNYRQARRGHIDLGVDKPLFYLVVQSFSPLLGVISLWFYMATTAIHHLEYHLLMIPRCFQIQLDETSRVDRFFGWLRSNPIRFYSIVIFIAGLATLFIGAGMGAMGMIDSTSDRPIPLIALIAIFDGLFVFHYLIDGFIWRFSDPHYRSTLAGLYFAPKPKTA